MKEKSFRLSPRKEIFSNERAMANAGSGKTYAIVSRFIALLCIANPDEICALTFTRLAAAEFLDGILNRLADASIDDKRAALLSEELKCCGVDNSFSRADFVEILRRVASRLPRLKLTTIDAFEVSFASAFANELGIFSGIKIIDDFSRKLARKAAIISVLEDVNTQTKLRDEFLSAVERASYGSNEKRLLDKIEKYISVAEPILDSIPNLAMWGDEDNFKFSIPPATWDDAKYAKNCALLNQLIVKLDAKKFKFLYTFFSHSRPGDVYSSSTKSLKQFTQWIANGGKVINFVLEDSHKKKDGVEIVNIALPTELAAPVRELTNMLVGSVLRLALLSTRAIAQITDAYEKKYESEVRMKGRLDFSDFARILNSERGSFARQLVEYRLDARFKHWLLDEFQDTSKSQWLALKSLLDEILQDETGSRTIFYVGDKKQSIYGFRGAEPELFDTIFDYYKTTVFDHPRKLNISRRSSKPVIEAINALFASPFLSYMGASAAARWHDEWTEHFAHEDNGTRGCVATIEPEKDDDDVSKYIFDILCKIYAANPDFNCAVMTQNNDDAVAIINGLRKLKKDESFSISGELDVAAASDNMACVVVLSALNYAFHPLETSDKEFLAMTPLGNVFDDVVEREKIIASVAEGGFECAVRLISERLKSACKNINDFELGRLNELLLIARTFDQNDSSNIDDFLAFANDYRKREKSKKSSVTVMTIHKSKGLTFDVVFLPFLNNSRGRSSSVRLREIKSPDGKIGVLNMPQREICDFDKNLAAIYTADEERDVYNNFCKFYVACTRPRYALYLFVDADNDSQRKTTFGDVIKMTFSAAHKAQNFPDMKMNVAYGTDDWFLLPPDGKSAKKKEANKECDVREIAVFKDARNVDLPAQTSKPSSHAAADSSSATMSIASYIAASKNKKFGTLVHAALSKIKCIEDFARLENSISNVDILNYVKRALSNSDISSFFTNSGNIEVFNEHKFSCIDGDRIVSGIIDRLMLEKSEDGKIVGAKIVDYKTEGLSAVEYKDKFSTQLDAYRLAVSKAFDLPNDKVQTFVIGLSNGVVAEI